MIVDDKKRVSLYIDADILQNQLIYPFQTL